MRIYITGVSGTGKTSLAEALRSRGVNAIDIDEISHWENRTTGETVGWEPGSSDEWHESHVWLCDIPRLQELLQKSQDSVALGHSSNQADYLPLFDKIFVLRCSPETIVKRLRERTNNDFGKHPAEQERILNWQKIFEAEMVEKGAQVLDCERPIEEIIKDINATF